MHIKKEKKTNRQHIQDHGFLSPILTYAIKFRSSAAVYQGKSRNGFRRAYNSGPAEHIAIITSRGREIN